MTANAISMVLSFIIVFFGYPIVEKISTSTSKCLFKRIGDKLSKNKNERN